jgi:hypothetical protein
MPHPFLPDRPVDEAESLRSLGQGGLPLRAQRRIAEHNQAAQPLFTSTFSAAEGVVARSDRHHAHQPSHGLVRVSRRLLVLRQLRQR